MPSIALFTYSVKPRGSVVHAACLAEALQDEGADVTLYALGKSGDAFFRPLRCPLVLFPAQAAPEDPDRLVEQRIGEVRAGLSRMTQRHDVYHAEDCLTASALVAAHGDGVGPVVRTVHHVERFESSFLAACQRRSIEKAALVLSVSACTARDVSKEFGRGSTVIHNGVDLGRFAADAPAGAAPPLAAALGLSDDDVVVLSVGGVEERKNTLRSLEAMIGVGRDHPRVRWIVVGGASIWDHSDLERRFDARLAELPEHRRRRVARVGAVDEATLTWLYRRSDALLAASLHEGWGLSVLEAMAASTAVVVSDRAPFTEFVDASTARLVEPESIADIGRGVLALTLDERLRMRLARAGADRARSFTWRRAARAHLEAYRTLGATRSRRPDPFARPPLEH